MSYLAYGFLNGAEVEAAGVANLGLQDRKRFGSIILRSAEFVNVSERQAFRWVQKYIGAFGGDRHKVTM